MATRPELKFLRRAVGKLHSPLARETQHPGEAEQAGINDKELVNDSSRSSTNLCPNFQAQFSAKTPLTDYPFLHNFLQSKSKTGPRSSRPARRRRTWSGHWRPSASTSSRSRTWPSSRRTCSGTFWTTSTTRCWTGRTCARPRNRCWSCSRRAVPTTSAAWCTREVVVVVTRSNLSEGNKFFLLLLRGKVM